MSPSSCATVLFTGRMDVKREIATRFPMMKPVCSIFSMFVSGSALTARHTSVRNAGIGSKPNGPTPANFAAASTTWCVLVSACWKTASRVPQETGVQLQKSRTLTTNSSVFIRQSNGNNQETASNGQRLFPIAFVYGKNVVWEG